MVADLRRVVVGRLAVNALEGVGDGEVIGLQPGQRQGRQNPLADDVMRESIGLPRGRDEEMSASRLLEGVSQLVSRQLAEGLEQRHVEVTADDRRRDQHALGRLAQAVDPAADQAPHALRELEVFLGVAGVGAAGAAEHALGLGDIEQ